MDWYSVQAPANAVASRGLYHDRGSEKTRRQADDGLGLDRERWIYVTSVIYTGRFMSAIARWCFGHRSAVIAAWVLVLVGLGSLSQAVKSDYNNSFSLPGTGSATAQQLLTRAIPAQAGDSDTIVWQVGHGTVRDATVTARMSGVLKQIAAMPDVAAVVGPYGPRGAAQISRDGRTAYATVNFARQTSNLAKADITRVIDAAKAARAPGLNVQVGGQAIEQTEQTPLGVTSAVGVLAAAVVLFIAFGSLLAMLLPIVTAIAGVGGGLMAIAPLTHTMNVVDFAPILGALIGLGVDIDYALFIVTRHRRGLQTGLTAAVVHPHHRRDELPAAGGGVPQPAHPRDRGGDEPARRGGLVRGADRVLPVGLGDRRVRPGPGRAGRGVPAGGDAGHPVRPVHGLPGVPGQPDERGAGAQAPQLRRGADRTGGDRPGHHRGGNDHDLRVPDVLVPGLAGHRRIRHRAGRRGRAGRVHPADRAGAGRHAHIRQRQLVAAPLARPPPPAPGHRTPRPRRRTSPSADPRAEGSECDSVHPMYGGLRCHIHHFALPPLRARLAQDLKASGVGGEMVRPRRLSAWWGRCCG
jgi:MMPL family